MSISAGRLLGIGFVVGPQLRGCEKCGGVCLSVRQLTVDAKFEIGFVINEMHLHCDEMGLDKCEIFQSSAFYDVPRGEMSGDT